MTDLFEDLRRIDDHEMDGLRDRLRAAADRERLVDVAYRTVDSPIGSLLLAATDEGLVRLAFERQGHDAALADLTGRVSARVMRLPGRLDDAARQLDEYFDGRRTAFELRLDLRLAGGFRHDVLLRLRGIGYGRTASYGAIAEELGHPGAARAVGTACRTNPVPVVVPCHRVVRRDGAIGDYAGGTEAKRMLLSLEAG